MKKKKATTKKQGGKQKTAENWVPSSRQVAIAQLLLNQEDRRTKGEKIKSIGLPERTFYRL